MKVGDVLRDLGRPIAYHSGLARQLGSIPAALMLAQLLYWSDKSDDGWVWKIESDWDEELAFSPDVLKAARKVLVTIGLIEHKRDGLPAKPYYRVDVEALDEWWERVYATDLSVENPRTGRGKIPGQGRGKSPDIPLLDIDDSIDDSHSVDVTFETFWKIYPGTNSKKADARKAWAKAIKKATIGTITAAAQRFASDPNLPEPQYIPHASTWLNGERWNDGPLPPRMGRHVATPDAPRLSKSRQNSDRVFERMLANERERSESDDRLGGRELAPGDH